MSVSKWAYIPEKCDGDFCTGDCDGCGKAVENAIRIIKTERECVQRAAKKDAAVCDRMCDLCDLVLNDTDIICAYDLAISALERDRWISASTPPDTSRFVLVMNDDGRCGVAQYVGYDIAPITPWQIAYCLYDVDVWDDEEQGPVCWWRELPEPPKEDKP